jgi:hypothetical protein
MLEENAEGRTADVIRANSMKKGARKRKKEGRYRKNLGEQV